MLLSNNLQYTDLPNIRVENVHRAFANIVRHFHPPRQAGRPEISVDAHVSPTARIGERVSIHGGATIADGVVIGDRCTIYPGVHVMAGSKLAAAVTIFSNAVLYENTVVGENTIIHSNASIGVYGFGYETVDGKHQLSAQLGNVEIGADVEIGGRNHNRPGNLRKHDYRRRHQDRQPGHDRTQLSHWSAQLHLLTSRDCWQLCDR